MSPPEDRVYTAEAATQAGKIDILATDSKHTLVVIELKANIASYSTLGQILSCMDSIKEELGKDSEAKEDGDHPDKSVRDFAAETIEEIRIFGCSEDSYGYVFYVMQKA